MKKGISIQIVDDEPDFAITGTSTLLILSNVDLVHSRIDSALYVNEMWR